MKMKSDSPNQEIDTNTTVSVTESVVPPSARGVTPETYLPIASGERHQQPPLARIDLLAATQSVAETLELTARLLAEMEISALRMRLDRNGFLIVWKSPHCPASGREVTALPIDAGDLSRSTASVGSGTTIEMLYRCESNPHTEKAVGALAKAAAIQAERCSRRAWEYSPPEYKSESARRLASDIARVARLPYGVLITGETGAGKTRAAREIHRRSARSGKPFVELNCAALPEQLVEAELFGYRKGAFTGADRDHKGLFEEADGGILFLDEIGDLPAVVQNKLLKAIDEKQIKRLGTNNYVSCDVQIIAATSRDLPAMVRRGEFREDLYCRLAALKIETVPLRERREDIPALIDTFLRETAETVSKLTGQHEEYSIETGAVEMLCAHHWSGNIRVLRNAIYELTSYVREGETITMERVQAALAWLNADSGGAASAEREAAVVAVEKAGGNLYSCPQLAASLQALAQEGDIILPVEVCILRRGETLNQWLLRAKQCGIEAAWRASSTGKLREAAARLGLAYTNMKSQLHRTRYRSSQPRQQQSAE